MSYDYRTGALPAGGFETDRQQIAAYPYPIDIANSGTTFFSSIKVAGTGDPRAIPKSIVAMAFCKEMTFSITLDTPTGSVTWAGTIDNGLGKSVNVSSGITTETGTEMLSQKQAFSRPITPPETEESEFLDDSGKFNYSYNNDGEDEEPSDSLIIIIDLKSIIYARATDEWHVFAAINCDYDDGEGEGGSASNASTGLPVDGELKIFGEVWEMTGTDGVTVNGSITPSLWLP